MGKQPKCPTMNEVTESLKILGVSKDKIVPLEERVLRVIIEGWKKTHKCPTVTDMSRTMNEPRPAINAAITRLVDSSQIFRVQRGMYVPNMVKRLHQQ